MKKVKLSETQKELKHQINKHEDEMYELLLIHQLKCLGLPAPTHHFKFHPDRNYQADLCYPAMKWIIEVDGGIWMDKAGHTTGVGYERDRIRDAEAALLGYKTTRFTTGMVEDGTAMNYIEKLFKGYL